MAGARLGRLVAEGACPPQALVLAYYLPIGLLLPAAGAASASAVPSLGPDSPGDALYLRVISGLQVD